MGQIAGSNKSILLAMILSFFLPGVGQMYYGQVYKGIVLLLVACAIGTPTVGLGVPLISLIAVIDAYAIGKKLNRGVSVGSWEFF